MKPDKPGIWEWTDEKGIKRLVEVVEIAAGHPFAYLRVYFWGGYYNVYDEPEDPGYEWASKAEWPDRWGNRVGDNLSLPPEQIYGMPMPEELIIIRRHNAMQAMRIVDRQGELE